MEINCGCLGPLSRPADKINWFLVVRDLVLALLSAVAIVASKSAELDRFTGALWACRWRFVLIGAAVSVVALIMLLMQRNRILTTNLDAVAHPEVLSQTGEIIEPFYAAPIGQKTEKIDFSASETTWLLIFSPTCHHCQQILPVWNQMWVYSNAGHDQSSRILGISINADVSMNFVKAYGIQFPVYVPADLKKFAAGIKVTVPCAILVDRNGKILKELIYYPPK
jgi:hypothetical protein